MRIYNLALVCFVWFFIASCPQARYANNFLNVTHYKIDKKDGVVSPGGILVVRHDTEVQADFLYLVDVMVNNFDLCMTSLGWPALHHAWLGIFVPPDWYTSQCSGEQLVPSEINYKLCENKGLFLLEECRNVHAPTETCPCVCNVRATIQDDFWIVTAPNLKLLTTELARMLTSEGSPWSHEEIAPCLVTTAGATVHK